jgi:hypothetical protein
MGSRIIGLSSRPKHSDWSGRYAFAWRGEASIRIKSCCFGRYLAVPLARLLDISKETGCSSFLKAARNPRRQLCLANEDTSGTVVEAHIL